MSENKTWADFTIEEINEADTSSVDGEQFLTEGYGVEEASAPAEAEDDD